LKLNIEGLFEPNVYGFSCILYLYGGFDA